MLLGHLPLSMSVAHQEQAQECSPLHSPCPELSASGTGPLLFIFICGCALSWNCYLRLTACILCPRAFPQLKEAW